MNGIIQGPRTREEFEAMADQMRRGPRIPGDATDDLLRLVRSGGISDEDEYNEDDEEFDAEDVEVPIDRLPACEPPSRKPALNIPSEILHVLESPEREELIEVARILSRSVKTRTLVFYTPIGDIRCQVNWVSCDPSQIGNNALLFVKTRANSLAFTPKPGATFDIGFDGYEGQTRVVCLADPQTIYPGVDLLCFMPHNLAVEKTGRLNSDAPSVVSGNPSDAVENGEPVVKGEKPMEKSAFNLKPTPPAPRDWDTTRES